MLVELDCKSDSLERIHEELQDIPNRDHPVILRKGLELFDLEGWEKFLASRLGWTLDKRHFEPDKNEVDVVKHSYSHTINWWEISYQPELATSYSFSNTRHPLHTDYAWWIDGADIDFDAMKKQAKSGGEQMFYPSKRLVDDLASKDSVLLNDLMTTTVRISKGDKKDFNETTIIRKIDRSPGYRLAWNYYRTERTTNEINDMCEAFFKFLEKQEATNSVFTVRCETGDCLALADANLLHGRLAFEASEPFDRVFLQSGWRLAA